VLTLFGSFVMVKRVSSFRHDLPRYFKAWEKSREARLIRLRRVSKKLFFGIFGLGIPAISFGTFLTVKSPSEWYIVMGYNVGLGLFIALLGYMRREVQVELSKIDGKVRGLFSYE